MLKRCSRCKEEKPTSWFYFTGYRKKTGKPGFDSYCRKCKAMMSNPNRKFDKPYKSHTKKRLLEPIEEVNIDFREIYILLKKIELNDFNINFIDGFRLLNQYINVYGDNIPDKYSEEEQMDMIYNRLKEYVNTNQSNLVQCLAPI
jgi:hypothetical protein